MSEQLDESKRRLEQAKQRRTTARHSGKSVEYGAALGWKAAVTLIAKYEHKPKGKRLTTVEQLYTWLH